MLLGFVGANGGATLKVVYARQDLLPGFVVDHAIFNDLTIAHMDGPVGLDRNIRFVRDQYKRDFFGVEFVKETHDRLAGARVEVSSRFVGQDQTRSIDDGAGDGDTLTFTTGHFARCVPPTFAQADAVECLHGSLPAKATSSINHGNHHIFQCAGSIDQVERLKDEADVVVSDLGELLFRQIADNLLAKREGPAGGSVKAPQDVHERTLAATGSAGNAHEFPFLDGQINTIEGVHHGLTHDVLFS